MRRLLAIFALFLPLALAQSPQDLAKKAVSDWLSGKYRIHLWQAEGHPLEKGLRVLERALRFPPPPPGLEVNLDAPAVETHGPVVAVRYPAALGERTGEVIVELKGGKVQSVRWQPEGGLLPPWAVGPYSGPVFLLLGLGFLLSLRFGALRTYWVHAAVAIRLRARLFLWTQAGLFAAFALGAALAYVNPALARLVQEVVGAGIRQIGLEAAFQNGPLGLAAAIFFWNLTRGLLLTTALPGLLFGIPALLVNLLRDLLLGFALSPGVVPLGRFLMHLPVIVLELGAYNTAVFGGLALLGEVLAGHSYRRGAEILSLSLLPATVLLFFAALYEAFEVML